MEDMENPHAQPQKDTPGGRTFAQLLARSRTAAGLTYGQLAAATGISKAALHKFEQGNAKTPNPTLLPPLARALGIPLADLYAAVGYEVPKGLPTFNPYLRSKYKNLPVEARDELAEAFARITTKYGYTPDGNGPAPGQDE